MQTAPGRAGDYFFELIMRIQSTLLDAYWFLPVRVLLSFIYSCLVQLRNWLFDVGIFKTHRVSIPVVSVGNISSGGSGKTILVQALANYFTLTGKHPAVLSRGYRRSSKGLVVVSDETGIITNPTEAGDEPYLMALNLPGTPVVVSEDRLLGARFLEKQTSVDLIILDDGFQHRRLHRDVDIVLIDFPSTPAQRVLPWGRLREPRKNAGRADVVLFSKQGLRSEDNANLHFHLEDFLVDWAGEPVSFESVSTTYGLFSGLGNNTHFQQQVESLLGPANMRLSFPDHATYDASQRRLITDQSCGRWVTTQKDFIKLDPDFCRDNRICYIGVKTVLPAALLTYLKQYFK